MADQDSMAGQRVSLKLLVDKQKGRVLFAEGGKDFIDFLFTFLTLPLGTVVKLLTKSEMIGSLGKLYESVENLNQTYMVPSRTKDALLSPNTSPFNPEIPLLQYVNKESSPLKFYKCSNSYCEHVSSNPRTICPNCRESMGTTMTYVAPLSGTEGADFAASGYVKETITYMIMDDLEVKPMSTISGITMLNRFNVKDIGAVEEKEVDLGIDEALELLKASLQSNTVLTDVFLGRNKENVEDSELVRIIV